ncbi:HAD family hydrolase [Actinomadura gamaensis]|uniref:HAD family hydrolase n=1 Tax=Actinomadura gamaensis TaxID=1763541 RepID=A0ABV9TRJ8_9ACTN
MSQLDESSTRSPARSGERAVLVDIGGVLRSDRTREVIADWAVRLGTSRRKVLRAVFAGNDETVLVGRMDEDEWWGVVAERLRLRPDELSDLRGDMGARESWNEELVAALRGLPGPVAIVSNAWPVVGRILARDGLADLADEIVLSCDVGYAKPDPRIFEAALRRLGVAAEDALFIDDAPANVEAARALGLSGHVHAGNGGTLARLAAFVR